jgi:quinol-cytochrome oxidoreductase complex cytochrome b subunit
LHFTLPFVLAALVAGHLLYLHVSGSSNPIGTTSNTDRTPFHPYFAFKDLVTVYLFLLLFALILFFAPDKLGFLMAYFDNNCQNEYNTVCLNYVLILHTQVVNVINSLLLLYLVKIVYILYLCTISYISRKLYNINNKIKIYIVFFRENYKYNFLLTSFEYYSYLIFKLIFYKEVNNEKTRVIITKKKEGSSKTTCVNTFISDYNDEIPEKEDQFSY